MNPTTIGDLVTPVLTEAIHEGQVGEVTEVDNGKGMCRVRWPTGDSGWYIAIALQRRQAGEKVWESDRNV